MQLAAVRLRQSRAVVDHLDLEAVGLHAEHGIDPALPAGLGAVGGGLHCFRGVLHQIGHRLRDQPAIEGGEHGCLGQLQHVVELGVRLAEQDHRLLDRLAQIARLDHRLGDARERGELVDHRLDVGRLALDRRRQLVEGLAVLGDDAAVLAPDAVGRQDDRGQRVLDLVRHAAGDLAPGARALRGDELGDVVEGDDGALVTILALMRELHGKRPLLAVDVQLGLGLRARLQVAGGWSQQLGEFRHGLDERLFHEVGRGHVRASGRPTGWRSRSGPRRRARARRR